jgi:ribosomal subunit interface protein
MRTTVKAKNIVLTEAISTYLDKRFSVLNKYIEESDDSVILDIEVGKVSNHHKSGDIFRAEANLTGHGLSLRVEEEHSDLYTAIDLAKDQLVEALRAKRHKRIDAIRRGGARIKAFVKGLTNRQ